MGVFYGVAGLVALRHVVINWRLGRRFTAILRSSATERAADILLALGAILLFTSGLALLTLQSWAGLAFIACWAVQAVYLLWAQRWYRPQCPVSARGRRQALDAFAIYSVATVVVIGLPLAGVLD